jgi:hypothetical protein
MQPTKHQKHTSRGNGEGIASIYMGAKPCSLIETNIYICLNERVITCHFHKMKQRHITLVYIVLFVSPETIDMAWII